jgi:tRNA(Leu) C34 or U34 (ribose-2'-O)-methylase TrmL
MGGDAVMSRLLWRNGQKVRELDPAYIRPNPPAVVLIDPKYPHNVGAVVRAAACYGLRTVLFNGSRVGLTQGEDRLPREERMRDYADVDLLHYDRPMELVSGTPVAMEFRDNATPLPLFEHPTDAVYVFGPEDGTLGRATLQHCHSFVKIPTRHCLNLSVAVATVLYDRMIKLGKW